MAKPKEKPKENFTPDWKSIGIGVVAGILLTTIIMLAGGRVEEWSFLGIKISFPAFDSEQPFIPAKALPDAEISLVSVSYLNADYDPRVIDLRTSATDGLAVVPGSLVLYDLWVNTPVFQSGDEVEAEIYLEPSGGSGLIGIIPARSITSNITTLDNILITEFESQNDPKAWGITSDWEKLTIYLYLYRNISGERVNIATSTTTILLNDNGNSWYFYPPYANLVSIVYQVNNGEAQVLDFRTAADIGINVQPGDQLRILEIWCHAKGADEGMNLFIESSLDSVEYDASTRRQSNFLNFTEGVHNLLLNKSFDWLIEPDDQGLFIYLARDEGNEYFNRGALIDRYIIPFNENAPNGLDANPLP